MCLTRRLLYVIQETLEEMLKTWFLSGITVKQMEQRTLLLSMLTHLVLSLQLLVKKVQDGKHFQKIEIYLQGMLMVKDVMS